MNISEEPDVGKLQVRFREGYGKSLALSIKNIETKGRDLDMSTRQVTAEQLDIRALKLGILMNFQYFMGKEKAKEAVKIVERLEKVIEAQKQEIEIYREMLKRLEWDWTLSCPVCGNGRDYGHTLNCELAEMLKEV